MKAFFVVIYACLAIVYGYDYLTAEEYTYRNESVRVVEGDTVWDIAYSFRQPGEDVRDVIQRIHDANGMDNSKVYVGDILQVPVRVVVNDDYSLAKNDQ